MKHQLSFGSILFIADNIVEVIVNQGVEMSLEMVEEYEDFLRKNLSSSYGILVNKINDYSYSYEAQLSIVSDENIKAMAIITYNKDGKEKTQSLITKRSMDNWNTKFFSGLEMGWLDGLNWLKSELL